MRVQVASYTLDDCQVNVMQPSNVPYYPATAKFLYRGFEVAIDTGTYVVNVYDITQPTIVVKTFETGYNAPLLDVLSQVKNWIDCTQGG